MRRLLRDVAEGRELGDVTTLQNAPILEEIKAKAESQKGDKGHAPQESLEIPSWAVKISPGLPIDCWGIE